jgi:hypothetical protein
MNISSVTRFTCVAKTFVQQQHMLAQQVFIRIRSWSESPSALKTPTISSPNSTSRYLNRRCPTQRKAW